MADDGEDENFIRCSLTPAERRRIEETGFVSDTNSDRTPERLFSNWRHLVEEVEQGGYDWEAEEYVHSLCFRDDLEDVIGMLAPERQGPIRDAVRPWDLRFDAATMELAKPILGKPPQRWWRYCVPRDPGANFLESAGKRLQYRE